MNPELKQRLIGAAVVTALATIFVPMLFDDPVDNKDKTVTELPLPEAPVKSTEISANKQQATTTKPAKTPNATTDEATAPGEEGVTEGEMVDDADAEANAEPPVNETTPAQGTGTVAEVEQPPVVEEESEPLDTGVVPAVKPAVKKPVPVAVEPAKPKVPAPTKITAANTPKQLPAAKAVEVAPKPVAKTAPTKPVLPPATATAPVQPKKPELVRYTIHAGSFSQQENASKLMKSLREKGIPVTMETTQSGKGPIYRLKIGPELDKKKAAANKAKLDKEGVVNVMITE